MLSRPKETAVFALVFCRCAPQGPDQQELAKGHHVYIHAVRVGSGSSPSVLLLPLRARVLGGHRNIKWQWDGLCVLCSDEGGRPSSKA